MKKSNESAQTTGKNDLEFPDWTGMKDSSKKISVKTAFELTELYCKCFPQAYRRRQIRPLPKCEVEFVL